MTILLYNDGRLLIDDGNPMEGVSLEGLIAYITDPISGEVLTNIGGLWTNGASALYVDEIEGESDSVILTSTYAEIDAAIDAGRAVFIRTESSGTYTLNPLATYGGDDDTGYTVTAGSDTYKADSADGALTKEVGEG